MEHKVDRLRRKGWSRNRIERWLAQVEADQERHAKVRADQKPLPSARDVRVGDVDERFLENMEKGVLYRVRR